VPTPTVTDTPTPTATPEESGLVPANSQQLKCEQTISEALGRLMLCMGSCHVKAAQGAAEGKRRSGVIGSGASPRRATAETRTTTTFS